MRAVLKGIRGPIVIAVVGMAAWTAAGQEANYDESKVPAYTLPDPLLCADGTKVANANVWRQKRRPQILKLFQQHVYGKSPGKPDFMTFVTTSTRTWPS